MNYKIVYFAFISDNFGGVEQKIIAQNYKLLPILRTTIPLFLIDNNPSYDDVKQC